MSKHRILTVGATSAALVMALSVPIATAEQAPAAPTDVTVKWLDRDTVGLSWSDPSDQANSVYISVNGQGRQGTFYRPTTDQLSLHNYQLPIGYDNVRLCVISGDPTDPTSSETCSATFDTMPPPWARITSATPHHDNSLTIGWEPGTPVADKTPNDPLDLASIPTYRVSSFYSYPQDWGFAPTSTVPTPGHVHDQTR